jgi:hypothetical protein
MSFTTSLAFYVVIGACVAAAIYLREEGRTGRERGFRIASALFFWPLYLPLLLERQSRTNASGPLTSTAPVVDSLAQAIQQVEAELDAALGSLDGWAEEALADEGRRLQELRSAWRFQADRIRQLDELLTASKLEVADPFAPDAAVSDTGGMSASVTDRRTRSDQARFENMRRLQQLRGRLLDDLLGTLAWVRELVTMIHLAKFSGAPASRAEELVSQIAAAVEGLSEASSWDETPSPRTTPAEAVSQVS